MSDENMQEMPDEEMPDEEMPAEDNMAPANEEPKNEDAEAYKDNDEKNGLKTSNAMPWHSEGTMIVNAPDEEENSSS